MQYSCYSAYNQAKSPWLSKIPEGWVESKFAFVKNVLTDYTANGSFADLKQNVVYKYSEDYARLVRLTDLRTNLKNDGIWVDEVAYRFLSKSALFGGEFLLANVGAHAGLFCQMPYINKPATLAPNMFMARFETDKVSEEFMTYVGQSDYVVKQLRLKATSSSAQPKLNKDDFKSVVFTYPDLEQQQKITAFLGFKTQQIDQLIEKKKTLIEKLNEQRIAVITQAVTKGLDKNAKMKPSGVDWLGNVPEHWDVIKLRFLVTHNFTNGIFKKAVDWGTGCRVVNVFDVYVHNDIVDVSLLDRLECDEKEQERFSAKHGDFFFVRSSLKLEGVGKSASVIDPEDELVFECHLVRGRPDLKKVHPRYLNLFLNSKYARDYLVSRANVVTMTTIDQSKFKDLVVSLPKYDEQTNIAKMVDSKLVHIDSMVNTAIKVIECLYEYRSSLITAAVTGKIDVRSEKISIKEDGV